MHVDRKGRFVKTEDNDSAMSVRGTCGRQFGHFDCTQMHFAQSGAPPPASPPGPSATDLLFLVRRLPHKARILEFLGEHEDCARKVPRAKLLVGGSRSKAPAAREVQPCARRAARLTPIQAVENRTASLG